ncbi:MAG: flagellar hook-length control protein FliK [Proteobacteria bacterium]|nr:flagellar hook-length control protein FliK [Pseudomonadota bacterium]
MFIGQIVNATVIKKHSPDSFILQIGNQQIEAKTDQSRPLNIGDQLKLVVEKQDNPVTLRVLQQNQTKVIHEAKQQLLRESMPKQAGMEKLTSVLAQVSKNVKDVIKTIPAPIEQQFKKLIEQLPVKNNLNNESGLKTAIKNSGIFLEAKLLTEVKTKPDSLLKLTNLPAQKASSSTSGQSTAQAHQLTQNLEIAKDLKTNLLQLSDVINKYKQNIKNQENGFIKQVQLTSPESTRSNAAKVQNSNKLVEQALKAETEMLSKHIESSIARIEVNQSKAIVTHDNQAPLWSIEMPVKDKQDIDLLKLNIHADRDSKSDDEQQLRWATDLKITFENIGTISAKLSVIDKEVNATLWSENEILNDLINSNLSLLNNQIEKCGLSTGKIVCVQETLSEQDIPHTSNNLINITI